MTTPTIAHDQSNSSAVVSHNGHEVRYATPNQHTKWRVDTLFTKEPDTLEWIAGFAEGDVLFDIGANVGMYSIWAAQTRNARVFAFEPESQNYAILNLNIDLNQLANTTQAFCIAISDSMSFDRLYLSELVIGGSCHNFGEALDPHYKPMRPAFTQGCFAMTLDALVAEHHFPLPHHIKIDVDGIEPKVVKGARNTIANPHVRSVLIEINTGLDDHWDIVDFMLDNGYTYSDAQVQSSQRSEGFFKGVGNYVFRR